MATEVRQISMRFRPLEIYLVSGAYLLFPLFFLGTNAVLFGLTIQGPMSVFHFISPGSILLLILFPAMALVIYQVRMWSWWVTLLFWFGLLFHTGVMIFENSFNQFSLIYLVRNTSILLATVLILRKNVRAPYFNPRLRWWDVPDRFRVTIDTEINYGLDKTTTGEIGDISEKGCFLLSEDFRSFPLKVRVRFELNKNHFDLECKIVRLDEKLGGVGVWFLTNFQESKTLKESIKWLRAAGAKAR